VVIFYKKGFIVKKEIIFIKGTLFELFDFKHEENLVTITGFQALVDEGKISKDEECDFKVAVKYCDFLIDEIRKSKTVKDLLNIKKGDIDGKI
jgi:hypothetical protein